MISVDRDGKQVRLRFDVSVPNYETRTLFLQWNCASHVFAGLLSGAMQRQMQDQLESIHRAAYEASWRDAKAKTAKQKWFRWGWRQMP